MGLANEPASPAPPPVRRRGNPDERRREVVVQAAELFDRDGYHATGVEELARAVGLSKPTLYHYFSGKHEILFWIHEEFIDLLIGKEEARPPLAAPEHLQEVMRDILGLMETHRGHVRVFFEHHRELPAESQESLGAKRDAYRDMVEGVIAKGVAEGDFRDVDPRLTMLAVFGMCNWAYQWFRAGGSRTSREIADLFFDLLFNGLRR